MEELTIKALLIRNIIHQQNPHRTPVVSRRDGPEALLARGIPDLQLHALIANLHRPYLEVNADGRDEGRGEGVLAEAEEAAGFPDARVADEE